MNTKNKKGFTLVELLAIIVVIGMIALIAVPTMSNVISDSKKKTFESSVNGLVESSKIYYSGKIENVDFEGKTFKFGEKSDFKGLKFKGKTPKAGEININVEGEIKLSVTDGEYCAFKDYDSNIITITEGTECIKKTESPIISVAANKTNTNTISLVAMCSYESGKEIKIAKYEFSKDGGKKWDSKTIDGNYLNYYTYSNLKQNKEYKFMARCVTTSGTAAVKEVDISLTNIGKIVIDVPQGWAREKEVTISYPKGRYVYQYQELDNVDDAIEDEEWIIVEKTTSNSTHNIFKKKYTENKYIVAKVIDSAGNYVDSVSTAIQKIDRIPPTCGSWIGNSTWTNKPVTVKLNCNEKQDETNNISGCTLNTYNVKTYSTTTKTANVSYTIKDNAGNTADCSSTVDVYVDATKPTLVLGQLTKTTKSITIPYEVTDADSKIKNTICEYGTSTSYGKSVPASEGKCVISGLIAGTEYFYKVTTADNAGNTTSSSGSEKTGETSVDFELTQSPTNTEYAQSKTIKVKYTATNVTNPTYYFKTSVATTGSVSVLSCGTDEIPNSTCSGSTTSIVANTWYKTTSNPSLVFKQNGTLYVRINDGAEYSTDETLEITKIDTTKPSLTLGSLVKTTKKITIPYTATDSQSGISKTTCVYGTSTSYGSSGTVSNGKCVISGLTTNTEYFYKITTTNKAGLSTSVTGSSKTGSTGVSFTSTQTPTDTEYAQSKTVKVTYTTSNVTNPTYYFKTSVATTSSVSVSSCGTATDPGTTCSGSTTSIVANTWYKTTNNPSLVFKANGNLYTVINDGEENSTEVTHSVTKIDTTPPNCGIVVGTIKTDRITLTSTCSDAESGIKKYEFSKDGGNTWDNNGTSKTITYTGLTQSKDYTFKVRGTNGSALTATGEELGKTEGIVVPSLTTTEGWAKSKTITATYNGANIENPSYYIMATVPGTFSSSVTQSCGSATDPGACTDISNGTTSLTANTWYKVPSTINLTVTSYGTIYAVTSDGLNKSAQATLTASADSIAPSPPTTMSFVYSDCSAYGGGWTNKSIYAARTCVNGTPQGPTGSTDTGGSGVAKYQISSNGSTWVDYAYDYTNSMYGMTSQGTHTRYFRAVDAAGNVSGAKSVTAYIDKTAPPTPSSELRYGTSAGTLRGTANTWTNQTLWWGKFSSTDTGGSGTSYYQYSTSCTGTVNGTLSSSYSYTQNANSSFCIRAVDNAGNASAWSEAYYIRIDKTVPGTASSTIRINNASGTVRANTTAWTNQTLWWGSFTATDNVGVSYYQYSTGCTGTASGTSAIGASYTYSSTVNYNFCIRAVDAAGNVGAWSETYYIKVDKTAPTCGSWSGQNSTWTKENVTVKVACSDSHSGCTNAKFSKEFDETKKTATPTVTIKDNAGNTASCKPSSALDIYVDKTKPTITMVPTKGTYKAGSTTVKVQCDDNHSGMKKAWLEDMGYETSGTSSTSQSLASTGTRTANGSCTDKVGNKSTASRKYTIVSSGSSSGSSTSCLCSGGCVCGSGTASSACIADCGL